MIEEVKEIFNENFKEKILNIEKIDGGWLTEKYRILTKNYDIMTKKIEFKKIERRKIDIEKASRILYQCNKEGIKCPQIYLVNNRLVNYDKKNKPIVFLEYIKDTYCKNYKNITSEDIYNIATEIAKMDNLMNKIECCEKINGKTILKQLNEEYNKRVLIGKTNQNEKYLTDVYKQEHIIKSLNENLFDEWEFGYCHCDLSSDNILFNRNGFRAIIDFEICNKSFIYRDPARIFLTFCLDKKGHINKKILEKLIEGYNKYKDFSLEKLVQGLKAIWCLEVNLWIKEAYYVDKNPDKVNKFISEINWITENWFNLTEILKY